jgi:lysosomal alpha-mannosidase
MNKHYSDKYIFQYSTPSNYIDAIAATNYTWSTKKEDLFPLEGDPASYWTGYFSSRANAKSFIRAGSSHLSASNELYSWAALNGELKDETLETVMNAKNNLLDQMSIYQHHDAVTGTARQDVADDYSYRLDKALKQSNGAYGAITDMIVEKMTGLKNNGSW